MTYAVDSAVAERLRREALLDRANELQVKMINETEAEELLLGQHIRQQVINGF